MDIESTTDQLFTPLLIAAFNGKLRLAKRLVAAGANIEAKNKQHYTAACIAAQEGHTDLLGFLLDRLRDERSIAQIGLAVLALFCFSSNG